MRLHPSHLYLCAVIVMLLAGCSGGGSTGTSEGAGGDGGGSGTQVLRRLVGPETTFTNLTCVAVDPSGLTGFAVDAGTGALTPVPGSPFAASRSVFAAAVPPQGRFIYTVELGQAIPGFSIDAMTSPTLPMTISQD